MSKTKPKKQNQNNTPHKHPQHNTTTPNIATTHLFQKMVHFLAIYTAIAPGINGMEKIDQCKFALLCQGAVMVDQYPKDATRRT